jgi:hypothetical protein
VRRWHYATAGRGAMGYYTLSPRGFRILHGHDSPPPRSHTFAPVGVACQAHTRALADFLVATFVAAHRAGVAVTGFRRENALRLELAGACLYPDAAFTLVRGDRARFHYFVEVDTGSERLESLVSLDSVARKVRFYDAYRDSVRPERFHVLLVTTAGEGRLGNLLACARRAIGNPQRPLVYAATLASFLAADNRVTSPCFHDTLGRRAVLVLPSKHERPPHPIAVPLPLAQVALV